MEHNTSLEMQYKTFFGSTETVVPKLNTYAENNNLYVGLDFFDSDFQTWLPYTDVTVNVGKLPFLESAIDTNNNGAAIIDFLVQNGFGELTDKVIFSGYCSFPVFRFNENKLREIDAATFEQYAQKVGPRKNINKQISEANALKETQSSSHREKPVVEKEL